ncbi:MAG: hypothetical protein U1B94_06985 [candidate division NC10 bacterium]|nr:hypothetical protein [candidate division NC10 bacterium]
MSIKRLVTLLVCIMVSTSWHGVAADTNLRYTGTYSSLEYHKGAGDLLGTEIKIVPTRRGYQGALQIAEGGPSELMVVDVFFEKDVIKFEIPKAYAVYGGAKFEGKIDGKGIKGAFRYETHMGDAEYLVRRPSYWDK